MTQFRLAGPVDPGAQKAINELVSRTGPYIQAFALLELIVAGWLLKLEASPTAAIEFMSKTSAIGSRIERLKKLLSTDGDTNNAGLIEKLAEVGVYRDLRNDIAHGVITHSGTFVSFISWRRHMTITPENLNEATAAIEAIGQSIFDAYTTRFGPTLDLLMVARTSPPPTS